METRRAAITHLNRVVTTNVEHLGRFSRPVDIQRKISDFSDDTLILLSAAVKDPLAGEMVTLRMIKFLSTFQHHGVEAVIRNIAIFTKEEIPYINSLGIKWDDRWKVFAFTESRVRVRITGAKFSADETEEQREAMVALFHAYFALSVNNIHHKSYSAMHRYTPYAVNKAMEDLKSGGESVTKVLDFFVDHSKDAYRLVPFVTDRGIVEPAILQSFLEHESAFSSGVL